jgi:hypothetical protein
MGAKAGQFDCQIAGARRDFEHPGALWQTRSNPLGASSEICG